MAEYTKRWPVWHNLPTQDTAIDAQALEGFDTALDKLLGKDTPANNDVPAWNTAAGGVLWSPPAPTSAGTSGTLAARPTAASASGRFYLATDQNVLYFSDGAAWSRVGVPAGATQMWFGTNAPSGYVSYDGTVLPNSTGIYADLFAHLGTTTTPDTRGRMPVGKGTHVDVDTIGDNDGVAVGSRRPKHNHTATAGVGTLATGNDTPDHSHTFTGLGGAAGGSDPASGSHLFGTNGTAGASARHTHPVTGAPSVTVGPQSGSEPNDGPAWITFLFIAKL